MEIYKVTKNGSYFIYSSELITGIKIKDNNDKVKQIVNLHNSLLKIEDLKVNDKIIYPKKFIGLIYIYHINDNGGSNDNPTPPPAVTGVTSVNNRTGTVQLTPEDVDIPTKVITKCLKTNTIKSATKDKEVITVSEQYENISIGNNSQILYLKTINNDVFVNDNDSGQKIFLHKDLRALPYSLLYPGYTPINNYDIVNKQYVDEKLSTRTDNNSFITLLDIILQDPKEDMPTDLPVYFNLKATPITYSGVGYKQYNESLLEPIEFKPADENILFIPIRFKVPIRNQGDVVIKIEYEVGDSEAMDFQPTSNINDIRNPFNPNFLGSKYFRMGVIGVNTTGNSLDTHFNKTLVYNGINQFKVSFKMSNLGNNFNSGAFDKDVKPDLRNLQDGFLFCILYPNAIYENSKLINLFKRRLRMTVCLFKEYDK